MLRDRCFLIVRLCDGSGGSFSVGFVVHRVALGQVLKEYVIFNILL